MTRLRTIRHFGCAAALVFGGLAVLPSPVNAADHRDGPRITDLNNTPAGSLELNALGQPTGAPAGASPTRFFFRPNFPQNFFGGANTLAIIIEIPRLRLQSSRNNPNITAWIRSLADIGDGRGFAQFDRTAIPSIN